MLRVSCYQLEFVKRTMISKADVKYVASLSRIHLPEDEAEKLTKNLEGILQYVSKLEKVNVSGIEPTSHVLPLQNVYREDTPRPSLDQKKALKNAPEQHLNSFKVPKVIE